MNEKTNSSLKQILDLNTLVPFSLCKLLACGTILINMQWSKNQEVQLVGMGVATLFSFVFGYLVIISLNIGLSYEISRKRHKPNQVGIYYQRALLINYIICAFLVTPILYISRRIVLLFNIIDTDLSNIIGEYLFQLIPSIYCFAFYDTTQTYLLAQEIYLAPLVINIFAVFAHFFMIHHFGAAWSKNFTDFGCCIAIYLYLILRKKKIESWIEWTIKCIQGWGHHMKFLQIIGLTTYLQSFFFFIFSVMAYNLGKAELVCHICFLNIYQILFLLVIGLKEGLMSKLGIEIKKQKLKISKKLGISTIKLFLLITVIFVAMIIIYSDEIAEFFIISTNSQNLFKEHYWILMIVLFVDALKSGLTTLLKSINQNYSIFKLNLFFLMLGCILGYLLCYKMEYGLIGLWEGWLISCCIHVLTNWTLLSNAQRKNKSEPTI